MNGYQLRFFTQQDRKKNGTPLAHWLIETARSLGIQGATLISGVEGFGHDRKIRSTHFFELADQPIEVTMAVSSKDADILLGFLRENQVNIFYTKTVVEYGMTCE